MEQQKVKRNRAINWDLSDKILLRKLIEDKISIIENKNCDTNTSRIKKDAWRDIENSFNNMSATRRDTAQLQAQWRGTKMKAKEAVSAYKKSLYKTGGGPPPKSPDPEHLKLMDLMPFEFEEHSNEFDCDAEIKGENVPVPVPLPNQREYKKMRKNPLSPNNRYEDDNNEDHREKSFLYDEDVEFLEESPEKYMISPLPSPTQAASPLPPVLPPPLRADLKNKPKSSKRKIKGKDDELLKQELFEMAMENRRTEKKYMKIEHDEKLKNILMERTEKLKTFEMERKQMEEIHQQKMKIMEQQNINFQLEDTDF